MRSILQIRGAEDDLLYFLRMHWLFNGVIILIQREDRGHETHPTSSHLYT